MIGLLPKWRYPDSSPAFYDTESVTAIEGVAKMGVKINELIEDYNKFVDEWNKKISEFEYSTNEELEVFEKSMRQEFQDFIDSVDIKVKLLAEEVKSVSVLEEDISLLKEDISELESELKESIENNSVIEGLKTRINVLEGNLLNFVEYQSSDVPYGFSEYAILNSIENSGLRGGGKIQTFSPDSNNLLPKEEDKVHTLTEVESYSISLGYLEFGSYFLKWKQTGEGWGEMTINSTSYSGISYEGVLVQIFEDGNYTIDIVSDYTMGGENKINGTISEIMLCYNNEQDKNYKPVGEGGLLDEYVFPEAFSLYGYSFYDFVEKKYYYHGANGVKDMKDYVTYGEFLYIKVAPGGTIKYVKPDGETPNGTIKYTLIRKA